MLFFFVFVFIGRKYVGILGLFSFVKLKRNYFNMDSVLVGGLVISCCRISVCLYVFVLKVKGGRRIRNNYYLVLIS